MQNNTFALIDCNNFYVSCERVFKPALANKPVAVLSNNDGCIVARSNEVKAMGVPMGAPYFKYKQQLHKAGATVFSSNYELYGDMSDRVMSIIESFCHDTEIYSIDEAFVNFGGSFKNPELEASIIRSSIASCTGIPVSIGIAPTKTLAKLANHIAKKHTTAGVFSLMSQKMQQKVLEKFPVSEIWGIGRRSAAKLNSQGIYTAAQLRDSQARNIRRHFSVTGERIVCELRGMSCIPLEEAKPKQNIVSSRSFGSPVTELDELSEAVSTYAARACEKARSQGSKAGGIYVYLRTNRFKDDEPQYRGGCYYAFDYPSADTSQVIAAARRMLGKIYRRGFKYKKAGVMLTELIDKNHLQGNLFTPPPNNRSAELMQAIDKLNKRMGKDTVAFAAQGIKPTWQMRRDASSPRYTTRWSELPIVKA